MKNVKSELQLCCGGACENGDLRQNLGAAPYNNLRFLPKKRRTTDRNMAKLAFSLDETTGFYENLCFLTKKRRTTDVQPGERSPTPGPRNLNENPAPEELSGKNKLFYHMH